MGTLTFTVWGAPVPKGSAKAFARIGRDKVTGAPRAFAAVTHDNPRTKSWGQQVSEEAVVAVQQAQVRGVPRVLEGPFLVEVAFRMPRPKYIKRTMPPHLKREDVDKLARNVLDGLTGICFRDDAQVVDLHVTKQYADPDARPCAVVRVTPL